MSDKYRVIKTGNGRPSVELVTSDVRKALTLCVELTFFQLEEWVDGKMSIIAEGYETEGQPTYDIMEQVVECVPSTPDRDSMHADPYADFGYAISKTTGQAWDTSASYHPGT